MVVCKYCKQDGFHWEEADKGWRLLDSEGKQHNCNQDKKRKAYWAKRRAEEKAAARIKKSKYKILPDGTLLDKETGEIIENNPDSDPRNVRLPE